LHHDVHRSSKLMLSAT